MKVILAGINIDWETLKELEKSTSRLDTLTPETISAAYARISRNPKPVNELRQISRQEIEKARKSNQNIVFDMGHNSIAEHAVFNIDIIGVSRLIVEEIEKFRLASYTEKSQRYIRLGNDFVIPEEIKQAGLTDLFIETIAMQNSLYHNLYKKLKTRIFEQYASSEASAGTFEGWAKEDARYIVSLATESQLGMTVNARTLELMLRRLASHPLYEANEYGKKLFKAVKGAAPSLIRYTEATAFEKETRRDLKHNVNALMELHNDFPASGTFLGQENSVVLINATADGDDVIVASLLHSHSNRSLAECRRLASRLSNGEKESLIKTVCRHMASYNIPLREFETAEMIFEATVSATCFAQLKRHRMATIISQQYDPDLGVTIPPMIHETGMESLFIEAIERTNDIYRKIFSVSPAAAPYILTNAHRKRVLIKVNVRELHHISRLREDVHAQWDIRSTAQQMIRLGRSVMPVSLMFACGKDVFEDLHKKILS
ncbi:MAG: FAD-dependent thymidylate synthase [Syntrophales bacterium]|nr:FAD-dependent thymidylate synthase [Syntrophales bacterium]MDY0044217.1 FAD-dependent thymidylate synthase [Syntrophales bacterium]